MVISVSNSRSAGKDRKSKKIAAAAAAAAEVNELKVIPGMTPSCSPVSNKEDFLPGGTLQTNNNSPALLWTCLHKQTCYVQKFNGVTFTREPMNWTGFHCARYCGLTNTSPVGVKLDNNKKGRLFVYTRNSQLPEKNRKPKNMIRKAVIGCSHVKSPKLGRILRRYNPTELNGVTQQLCRMRQTKQ
eukprot:GHVS01009356.1.p1 GENE.GHVS01009356.1~~GHVS01009356.1.p1  ORF type:complete len:186 (+),score=20.75 GHVS01009356.1:107-664(+)